MEKTEILKELEKIKKMIENDFTKYETIAIIKGDATEKTINETKNEIIKIIKIENIEKIETADKKKLAYKLKGQTHGHYINFHWLGDRETVAELERALRVNENILTFLNVKMCD